MHTAEKGRFILIYILHFLKKGTFRCFDIFLNTLIFMLSLVNKVKQPVTVPHLNLVGLYSI